jgi:DNA-binding transcriptional MerR regulator
MPEQLFSQREVNNIFSHVPSRTLRWWALMKLYDYSAEVHDRRGVHRQYHLENLYQIGIVEALTSLNFQASQIEEIKTKNFSALGITDRPDVPPLNQKMEGVLLIAISPRSVDADKETRLASSWHPSLANLLGAVPTIGFTWDTIQALKDCDTVILLNLKKIKQKVDSRVAATT